MMPNYHTKLARGVAGFCFFALLALYTAGSGVGGAGFRPAVAAPAQVMESVYLELAVADLEQAAATVQWQARRYDGWVEDNYRWEEPGERWASITLLLPAGAFDWFYQELATTGTLQAERRTSAAGNRILAETRVTVLLVAASPAARQLPPAPRGEPPRPIATGRPASPLRIALAIASSLYQALVALLPHLAAFAERLLLAILAAFWLLWHARRRPPKKNS